MVILRIGIIWVVFAIICAFLAIVVVVAIIGLIVAASYFVFYYLYLIIAYGCFGYNPARQENANQNEGEASE
jgi:hypothetical protein